MRIALNADDSPTAEDDESCLMLLAGVNACWLAFKSGWPCKDPPAGLESLLAGVGFERIKTAIKGCTRMSVGITYRGVGPWAEIRFCQGPNLLMAITMYFEVATDSFGTIGV